MFILFFKSHFSNVEQKDCLDHQVQKRKMKREKSINNKLI